MLKSSTASERIESLDSLRGFALLGIILANIPFSGELIVSSPFNAYFDFFHNQFIAHKFLAIFSILFGVGFYLQFKRFSAKQLNFSFNRYFIIRMLLLFIIGCFHAYLLWLGDIIRAYALGGILLLLVRNWSDKGLLMLSIVFAVLLTGVMFILIDGFDWQTYTYPTSFYEEHKTTNSYLRYLYINFTMDSWVNFVSDMPVTIFYTFGSMLLGFILGRVGFFDNLDVQKRLSKRFILWGVILGLPLNYVFYLLISGTIQLDLTLIWLPFVLAAGMLIQALMYISLFLKLYHSKFSNIVSVFNRIGRMALSNYVLQSVFLLVVFFHASNLFQLYGRLSCGETYLVAIVLFMIQVGLSAIWLVKFKQGPLEWIWKKIAYSFNRYDNRLSTNDIRLFNEKQNL